MNKKTVFIVLCILVCLLSCAFVSAADSEANHENITKTAEIDSTISQIVEASDTDVDVKAVLVTENDDVLTAGDGEKSFTHLQELIDTTTDDEITLMYDYRFDSQTDSSAGIG